MKYHMTAHTTYHVGTHNLQGVVFQMNCNCDTCSFIRSLPLAVVIVVVVVVFWGGGVVVTGRRVGGTIRRRSG